MFSKNKLIYCFALLLFIFSSCKEDTVQPELFGSIEGIVLDAEDNSPVVSAAVSTAPATTSLITNSEGKFSYTNISTGSYTISVSKTGYDKKSVTVSVKEDEITPVTILLDKSAPSEGPGKVTDPTPPNEATDQPIQLNLIWQPDTIFTGLIIKYDVYLFTPFSPMPELIAGDLEDTTVYVENLIYDKTYYWQVNAKLQDTLVTEGDIWGFSTRALPDYRFFYSSKRDGNYDIFYSDTSLSDIIKLTTNRPYRDWWPRLSPNRRNIAFVSDENVSYQIYQMNRDGSDIRRVTTIPIAGFHNNGIGFNWSPDGGKFIYAHYNQLYSVDENGANLTLIATAPAGRHFRECEWSYAGDKIITLTIGEMPYDSEIYTMDANGSNMNLVVDNLPGTISGPTWSIDGNSILYSYDVSGFESPDGRQLDSRIFFKSLIDTTLTDLSQEKLAGTNDTYPRYSPDGARIIFENTSNDGFNPKNVWIMESDGDNRLQLFQNAETPEWK